MSLIFQKSRFHFLCPSGIARPFSGALKHRGSKKGKGVASFLVRQSFSKAAQGSPWAQTVWWRRCPPTPTADTHMLTPGPRESWLPKKKVKTTLCRAANPAAWGGNPRGTTKRQAKLFPCMVNENGVSNKWLGSRW